MDPKPDFVQIQIKPQSQCRTRFVRTREHNSKKFRPHERVHHEANTLCASRSHIGELATHNLKGHKLSKLRPCFIKSQTKSLRVSEKASVERERERSESIIHGSCCAPLLPFPDASGADGGGAGHAVVRPRREPEEEGLERAPGQHGLASARRDHRLPQAAPVHLPRPVHGGTRPKV